MHDLRHRHDSEAEGRGWRERERAQGSWRDHGDGGYFEPSRGRWDDDRRYTRSRQEQYGSEQNRASGRALEASGGTSTSGDNPKSGSRLP